MENENNCTEPLEKKPSISSDFLFKIIVTDFVCIAVTLITITAIKYISPKLFSQIKTKYTDTFLTETSISQVMDSGDGYAL